MQPIGLHLHYVISMVYKICLKQHNKLVFSRLLDQAALENLSGLLLSKKYVEDLKVNKIESVRYRLGFVQTHMVNNGFSDDWRADQYRWRNNGATALPKANPLILKSYFVLDTKEGLNNNFKRHAYQQLDKSNLTTIIH